MGSLTANHASLQGDFNADIGSLSVMRQMLASGWSDLGGLFDLSATCLQQPALKVPGETMCWPTQPPYNAP